MNNFYNAKQFPTRYIIPCHASNGHAPRAFFSSLSSESSHSHGHAPRAIQSERPAVVLFEDRKKHAISETGRTIVSMNVFKERFANLSHNIFDRLSNNDWGNVVVAGESVLHCLTPGSIDQAVPNINIKLFLYGLDDKAARRKINTIYDRLNNNSPVVQRKEIKIKKADKKQSKLKKGYFKKSKDVGSSNDSVFDDANNNHQKSKKKKGRRPNRGKFSASRMGT